MFSSPSLNALLEAELAAGNQIAEDGPSLGSLVRLILLATPFKTPLPAESSNLLIRQINDPHWWKTEIEDSATHEMLACKF